MADWNLEQTWLDAYRIRGGRPNKQDSELVTGDGFGEIISYLDGRKYALQLSDDGVSGLSEYRFRLQKLSGGGFSPAAETLVVGCGFGWLIEVLVDVGSNNVWGSEIGSLIWDRINDGSANLRADIIPLILNVNILDLDAANQFKALGAGNNKGEFRNIVTEHLLDDWDSADMDSIFDACDNIRASGQSNVFHLVTAQDSLQPGQTDPTLIQNLLILSEWKALRPDHIWIDLATGNIL